ncbi:hypothetical protein OESDEN_03750, partial [Oesophagostomum dentatum]
MWLLVILSAFYSANHATAGTSWNGTVQAYKHSDKPIELECADEAALGNLSKLPKFWQKDGMDISNNTNIKFTENNATIKFTSLAEEDSGIYSCCVKSAEKKPFECFDRFLNVVNEDSAAAMLLGNGNNVTEEARNATAWSVIIAEDRMLYAREGDTYFVKIFEENTTDIKCEHDGGTAHVETVSHSHAEYGDILFHPFNATLHPGDYICNSSYTHDNLTDIVQITFAVTESPLPNTFEKVLDPSLIATLVTQASFAWNFFSIVFVIVVSLS